jgi:hypothetical protein
MQHLLAKDAQRIPDRLGSLVSKMASMDSALLYLIVKQKELLIREKLLECEVEFSNRWEEVN